MSNKKPLIIIGNRVRQLIKILNLREGTELNRIVIHKERFQCYTNEIKYYFGQEKYRITKQDIKQIKIIYEITGDRETALMHLIKD